MWNQKMMLLNRTKCSIGNNQEKIINLDDIMLRFEMSGVINSKQHNYLGSRSTYNKVDITRGKQLLNISRALPAGVVHIHDIGGCGSSYPSHAGDCFTADQHLCQNACACRQGIADIVSALMK